MDMLDNPVYNQIGFRYNQTRKADPFISDQLYSLLEVDQDEKYLDLGCGTGNYLQALIKKGVNIWGVDPSKTMLQEASSNGLSDRVFLGSAEHIPFPSEYFKGTMAVLTTHHWTDLKKGFQEINRCTRNNGVLVLFTFTPDQVRHYWLKEYFPKMIEVDSKKIPPLNELKEILLESGFTFLEEIIYEVRDDLIDQFMYAHKNHPEKYLDEEIRKGISAFRLAPDPEEIGRGLIQIKKDMETGKILNIIHDYSEKNFGDYVFLKAQKKADINP